MAISVTTLRQNIFKYLDQVAETGEPLEVTLKGRKLKVVAVEKRRPDKLARLVNHKAIVGNAEDLASLDMSHTWKGRDQL